METEVDILKLHIGYADSEILMSSSHINKCNYVCGEMKLSEDKIKELIQVVIEVLEVYYTHMKLTKNREV